MKSSMSVLQTILGSVNESGNAALEAAVSALATALRRRSDVLVSHPPGAPKGRICKFIEYALSSLVPADVTVEDALHGRAAPSAREQGAYRVLIVQNYDMAAHEQRNYVMSDEAERERPRMRIALVSEASHLPKHALMSFAFHVNVRAVPGSLPKVDAPLFRSAEEIGAQAEAVFVHNDLITYIGKLILFVNCKPMLTSFINAGTKVALKEAVRDFAALSGRSFVIPDDVQVMFPVLLSHRFLLPGETSFRKCMDFLQEIIFTVHVPN